MKAAEERELRILAEMKNRSRGDFNVVRAISDSSSSSSAINRFFAPRISTQAKDSTGNATTSTGSAKYPEQVIGCSYSIHTYMSTCSCLCAHSLVVLSRGYTIDYLLYICIFIYATYDIIVWIVLPLFEAIWCITRVGHSSKCADRLTPPSAQHSDKFCFFLW